MKSGAMTPGKFLSMLIVCLFPFSTAHAGTAVRSAESAVQAPTLFAQERGVVQPVEERALRPQPEPPGKEQTPQAGKKALQPGETRMLRPQPEPPGKEQTPQAGELIR